MPYGSQKIIYCLHACITNYHRIIGHPPIAVEPSNNQWLIYLSESPEVQLFPANCKLLISCRALGAGEERWQRYKGNTFELFAQAYCCPLSFYIDRRYRSQRAAGSTKIVARFLLRRLDLLRCLHTCADAITAECLNSFDCPYLQSMPQGMSALVAGNWSKVNFVEIDRLT